MRVSLRVLDVNGRLVRELANATLPAGVHTIHWDGRDARGNWTRGGVYWVQLGTGGLRRQTKLVRIG